MSFCEFDLQYKSISKKLGGPIRILIRRIGAPDRVGPLDRAANAGIARGQILCRHDKAIQSARSLEIFVFSRQLKQPEPTESGLRVAGEATPAHGRFPVGVELSRKATVAALERQQNI